MATIRSTGYNIYTGSELFKSISTFLKKNKYDTIFILCDENTFRFCLPQLVSACRELQSANIIEVDPGENSKSLEICAHIWQTFIDYQADKNALLVNLGGGVVSDLGGFCASVYKRGIDFINIPTSLLAMADASVGGKTAIDFAGVKNSIGTFKQPKAVFINTVFLKTLPSNHYKNGLAEIFKIALVADKLLWQQLASEKQITNEQTLINKSVTIKNKIVLKDPFDKGIRKSLNFGHTIGHAIEAGLINTSYEILHGEAVLTGMIIESHIAMQKRLLSKTTFTQIISTLQSNFDLKRVDVLTTDHVLELIKNDKKKSGNNILFALVDKPGSCLTDIKVNDKQIVKAIEYYNSLLA